jgi:phosphopantetheinyl transferase (holo-ACP synthase)
MWRAVSCIERNKKRGVNYWTREGKREKRKQNESVVLVAKFHLTPRWCMKEAFVKHMSSSKKVNLSPQIHYFGGAKPLKTFME